MKSTCDKKTIFAKNRGIHKRDKTACPGMGACMNDIRAIVNDGGISSYFLFCLFGLVNEKEEIRLNRNADMCEKIVPVETCQQSLEKMY